jgi:hypothetical protein
VEPWALGTTAGRPGEAEAGRKSCQLALNPITLKTPNRVGDLARQGRTEKHSTVPAAWTRWTRSLSWARRRRSCFSRHLNGGEGWSSGADTSRPRVRRRALGDRMEAILKIDI